MKPVHAFIVTALLVGAAVGFGYRHAVYDDDEASLCASEAMAMVRTELLFGLSTPDGGAVNDAEWSDFLATEVTPRFPDGLTVLKGYGQWLGDSGSIAKEDSIVLLIWHAEDPARDTDIEAIRAAYKTRFEQESVMRVTDASCVSF